MQEASIVMWENQCKEYSNCDTRIRGMAQGIIMQRMLQGLAMTISFRDATKRGALRLGKLAKQLMRTRYKKVIVFGGATLFAVSFYGVVANGYIVARATGRIYTKIHDVPQKEVAIVLGAKVNPDGAPSMVLRDRLLAAKYLYEANKVRKILVSGDHGAREYDEPKAMYRFLVQHGIPKEHIFLDHAGLRTFDTMARAAKVFGVKDAVICTQKFHLQRSVFLARHHGIDAVGLVSDLRKYRHHSVNLAREFIARSVAVLDAHLLNTQPKYSGPAVSMDGDAHLTHDQWTDK